MSSKRTPINRPPRGPRATPTAKKMFRYMQDLKLQCTCTCAGHDNCKACAKWDEVHEHLCNELGLKCFQFPAFVHPDEACPYPLGTAAALWWPGAQQLYRELDAA
jgi:hypothetical protein